MIFRKSETDSIQSKSERKVKGKSLSRVRLFATPWTTQSMEFSRPEYWSGQPFHYPGDLPNPGIEPKSPTLQADSLPAEPPGKPKNTGVGSLSLLQQIFLTQEWNQGLLHCKWVIYQLGYQGSPFCLLMGTNRGKIITSPDIFWKDLFARKFSLIRS